MVFGKKQQEGQTELSLKLDVPPEKEVERRDPEGFWFFAKHQ